MFILAFALCMLSKAISAAIDIHPSGGAAGPPAFAEDRVLVKFKPGLSAAQVTDALARAHKIPAVLTRKARFFDTTVVGVSAAKTDIPIIVKAIAAWPEVEYAEPDYVVHAAVLPNDTMFSSLWGLRNTGQTGGTPGADINATEAWDTFTGDATVVVGVIDTGIDYNHPDLAANMWVNPGEIPGNGIDDDGNGYIDDIHGINAITGSGNPMDDQSHGTHCAGTIGAVGNNSRGVVGVAWNVKLMALKFLDAGGYGYTSDAVEALEYATRMKTDYNVNIKITSNSWGGGGYSQSLADAITASDAAGILFVAAAGNSSVDTDTYPHYPSSFQIPNVISVASSDHMDALSWFSNYGATSVHLAAPGSDIYSTVPGNSYASYSGTSMATPHVAGAAALLWGYEPGFSLADVKSTLLNTVDTGAAFIGRTVTGGRLNLKSALNCDPGTPMVKPSLTDGFTSYQGQEKMLSVAFSACTPLTGAQATAAFSNGDAGLTLLDDGLAPDLRANDGIYTTIWTPQAAGFVDVSFTLIEAGTPYVEVVSGEIIEAMTYFIDDEAVFDWQDISTTGTELSLTDDSVAGPITFDFNYYGLDYTGLYVSSNGVLYFGTPSANFINQTIPGDNDGANTFIAPLWDDLYPSPGGVYYQVFGTNPNRQLVVQWHNITLYGGSITGSFQVILDESDGSILFQYLDTDFADTSRNHGADATIGLQRAADYGQLFSYDQASLTNPQSILWRLGGNRHRITTSVSPAGAGTVTCTPNPVNDGSDSTCTATASTGHTFSRWAGDCSGTQPSCRLQSMTSRKSVTANFTSNIDYVGLYAPGSGRFYLRNAHRGGPANVTFGFGPAGRGWLPLTGDWNGDGQTTIGFYNPLTGIFYLRNAHGGGPADVTFAFGSAGRGWQALTGDWDGDGRTTVGLYNPSTGTFYLRNANTAGPANVTFRFGPAGRRWLPLTGDWDADGRTTVGLYNPLTGTFYLRNAHAGGAADVTFAFGPAGRGWLPLTGDWNGNGRTTTGLYNPWSSTFYLRNAHRGGSADVTFAFGPTGRGWTPLTGDWVR
ncbi:S8 family serine peptidase [Thiocapsa rosea]|nr:S8 family serine peptidase [Thiocapsa rosea]